jgi:hypothetical protein
VEKIENHDRARKSMMASESHVQKGGNSSTNIQVGGDVHFGLTYNEARQIALDVFKGNFLVMAGAAAEIAADRAKEFTEDFLRKLQERNPRLLGCSMDPDFQYSLFVAQREYAKSGEKQLAEILSAMLLDRADVPSRSLLRIVLNEAIAVAPKLTRDQLAALAVGFSLSYGTYGGPVAIGPFVEYIDRCIAPFVPMLPTDPMSYRHLEYVGCLRESAGETKDLHTRFRQHYTGLFSSGFDEVELRRFTNLGSDRIPLVTRHWNNAMLLRVDALNSADLMRKGTAAGLERSVIDGLTKLLLAYCIRGSGFQEYLLKLHPCVKQLNEISGRSLLLKTVFTSVGVALGHAYLRAVSGESGDLCTWIHNENFCGPL